MCTAACATPFFAHTLLPFPSPPPLRLMDRYMFVRAACVVSVYVLYLWLGSRVLCRLVCARCYLGTSLHACVCVCVPLSVCVCVEIIGEESAHAQSQPETRTGHTCSSLPFGGAQAATGRQTYTHTHKHIGRSCACGVVPLLSPLYHRLIPPASPPPRSAPLDAKSDTVVVQHGNNLRNVAPPSHHRGMHA